MSNSSKNIIIIIIVIVIIGGIWWYISSSSGQQATAPAEQNTSTTPPSQTSLPTAGNVSYGNPEDTSDVAINSDLLNIDGQLKSLNTDSNNVNQSLIAQ